MKRFKNILLVIGPAADDVATVLPALSLALSLAGRNQARLTLISVVEELPPDLGLQGGGQAAEGLFERLMEDSCEQLRSRIEAIDTTGIEVDTRVVSGTPFLAIIRQVLRDRHDLVMVTTEGSDGLKARLFGNNTMHLMRKCPCPVWAIKPTPQQRFSRILAAVDPGSLDDDHHNLDRLVMDLATSLAQSDGSELHVVHAWHIPGERQIRNRGVILPRELDMLLRRVRDRRQMQIDDLLKHYSSPDSSLLPSPRVHLIEGRAGEEIPELVRREGIDLLVMGTVCRTGVAGFFIGNTAEGVLANVDCSVLSVKPEGFVTPVTLENR